MNWINCQDVSGLQYVINLDSVQSVLRNPDGSATFFQTGGLTTHVTKIALNTRDTIFAAATDEVEPLSWDNSRNVPSIDVIAYGKTRG
jgi:hypothetical protein